MEQWKELCGHPQYMVSTHGRIMRKATGELYSGYVDHHGYVRFDLCENGKRFVVAGHRAVAMSFLQPESDRPYVNHKDGDKTNNSIDNLEWCTAKENSRHAFDVLGARPHNMIPVKCIETGEIFESATAAGRWIGTRGASVTSCCRHKKKSARNYHWEYAAVAQR